MLLQAHLRMQASCKYYAQRFENQKSGRESFLSKICFGFWIYAFM